MRRKKKIEPEPYIDSFGKEIPQDTIIKVGNIEHKGFIGFKIVGRPTMYATREIAEKNLVELRKRGQ